VEQQDTALPGGGALRVTVSAGVAALGPDEGLEGLMKRADEALYAAKRAGRNRVVADGEALTPAA